MPIVLVRIDDRLVHGQIVQGWLKNIDVNKILVVSDLVAANEMQKMLMAMAVPAGVELDIKTAQEALKDLTDGCYNKPKTMILAADPKDVLFLINNGVDIKSVNVGGMHFVDGKRQLLCNLSVNDEDIKNLYGIYSKSVELEGRILPGDERINLIAMIEKEYKAIK